MGLLGIVFNNCKSWSYLFTAGCNSINYTQSSSIWIALSVPHNAILHSSEGSGAGHTEQRLMNTVPLIPGGCFAISSFSFTAINLVSDSCRLRWKNSKKWRTSTCVLHTMQSPEITAVLFQILCVCTSAFKRMRYKSTC